MQNRSDAESSGATVTSSVYMDGFPTVGACGVGAKLVKLADTTSNPAGLSRHPIPFPAASLAKTSASFINGFITHSGLALKVHVTVLVPAPPVASPLTATVQDKTVLYVVPPQAPVK